MATGSGRAVAEADRPRRAVVPDRRVSAGSLLRHCGGSLRLSRGCLRGCRHARTPRLPAPPATARGFRHRARCACHEHAASWIRSIASKDCGGSCPPGDSRLRESRFPAPPFTASEFGVEMVSQLRDWRPTRRKQARLERRPPRERPWPEPDPVPDGARRRIRCVQTGMPASNRADPYAARVDQEPRRRRIAGHGDVPDRGRPQQRLDVGYAAQTATLASND